MKTLPRHCLFLMVFAALSLTSCKKKMPAEVIKPAEMENILYDYHLAQAVGAEYNGEERYKRELLLQYVFEKHYVTEAEFDSSMVWYTRHAEELATIYRSLQERLEREEKQMKEQVAKRDNQIDVSMSGDTVDVWQDRTLYWLSASSLTNKVVFDLKTDTTFKSQDAMELQADFHFIPSKATSGKAVMALNFYFDNDSVQGLTRIVTRPGKQRLYLRPDSAFTIQSVSGFIYYSNNEHPDASLLVDDIRLTRYHNHEMPQEPVDTLKQERDTLQASRAGVRTIDNKNLQPMRKMENRK